MSQKCQAAREKIHCQARSGRKTCVCPAARHGKDESVIVGVPKETYPGERRVALVPAVIPNITKAGMEVIIESGAGEQAGYPDAAYVEKGAKIVPDRATLFRSADAVLQVLCYGSNE